MLLKLSFILAVFIGFAFVETRSANASCLDEYAATLDARLSSAEAIAISSDQAFREHQAAMHEYLTASTQPPTGPCPGSTTSPKPLLSAIVGDTVRSRLAFADEALHVVDTNATCAASAFAFAAGVVAQAIWDLRSRDAMLLPTNDNKALVSRTLRYASELHVNYPNLCCSDGSKHVYLQPYDDAYTDKRSSFCESLMLGPNKTILLSGFGK